jgi:hypothetical protein
VLLEFAGDTLGVQIDGRQAAEIPAATWPTQRHEGFALVREAGLVAAKDVWMTAGELPGGAAESGAAGARGQDARGKKKRN